MENKEVYEARSVWPEKVLEPVGSNKGVVPKKIVNENESIDVRNWEGNIVQKQVYSGLITSEGTKDDVGRRYKV